jgi:hypothetical protein
MNKYLLLALLPTAPVLVGGETAEILFAKQNLKTIFETLYIFFGIK